MGNQKGLEKERQREQQAKEKETELAAHRERRETAVEGRKVVLHSSVILHFLLKYARLMASANPKVLLIEDNASFRKTVARILTVQGFEVSEAAFGKAGLASAAKDKPDLIVLDLVLPGLRGIEVCEQLKKTPETAGIPILVLTGNDREGQDIACLDTGADDYLTKPVKTERLLAHCRALLRRAGGDPSTPDVSVGALRLDYGRKLAVLKAKEHPELTPKEFGLLYELARRSPEPLGRETIYERVWGMAAPSEGSLKTVDVHVRRIRLKLGWEADEWLSYVHGRGYALVAPRR